MTEIRRIPITVPPMAGEAIDSWLETLAHRTQTAWVDLTGAVGRPRDAITRLSPQEAEDLSAATGVAVDQLHAMTLARYDGIALTIDPKTGRLDKKFPWHPRRGAKFCPHCLAESGGRWPLSWRLTWTFACLKHRCLLTSSCPSCGRIPRHVPIPDELAPTPGRCSGRRPGVSSRGDRCHHALSSTEVLHLHDGHPALTAQRIVDNAIATGRASFGIYAHNPQPTAFVLADIRAIAGKTFAYATTEEIGERLPPDLVAAYLLNKPAQDDRAGNHPRAAYQPPAETSITAAGVTIALQCLMSSNTGEAATSLRWLFDRIRTPTMPLGPAAGAPWRNIGTSSVLAAVQSAAPADPKPIDKLRHGPLAGGRRYPQPSAAEVASFAQKLPTLLWPPWSLPLTTGGHMHRSARKSLPVVILLQAYAIAPNEAAHRLNSSLQDRQIARVLRLLTRHHRWPPMHQAIIAYTDWLRSAIIPIDYTRRRQIDYTDVLPDQTWFAMCRETATAGTGPSSAGLIRDYLIERISAAPSPGDTSPARRTMIADCPFHLTPGLVRELDDYAQIFLKDKGIHNEPVTYSPPTELIEGFDLPGKDLLNFDVNALHTAIASSRTRTDTLQRANITLEAARYALSENPVPPQEHRDSRAIHRARVVLPPHRLYELHHAQGQSLKTIGEAAGVSRQTITRLAHYYGMPTQTPGRPVHCRIHPEWLYAQYIVKNRTIRDIADELDVSVATVARWAKNYGIPLRPRGGRSHKSALLEANT